MLDNFNEHCIFYGHLFDTVTSTHGCLADVGSDTHDLSVSVSPLLLSLRCIEPSSSWTLQNLLAQTTWNHTSGTWQLILLLPLSFFCLYLSLDTNEIHKLWKSAFVVPLLKGGALAQLNNYRPISKLCVLAKVLETLISKQLKDFFCTQNILSDFQSGFRKKHSTTTAALKVINYILESLDNKQHCAALFIDLSKASDTVDYILLKQRLVNIGLAEQAVN